MLDNSAEAKNRRPVLPAERDNLTGLGGAQCEAIEGGSGEGGGASHKGEEQRDFLHSFLL